MDDEQRPVRARERSELGPPRTWKSSSLAVGAPLVWLRGATSAPTRVRCRGYGPRMRLKGRKAKQRVREVRQALQMTGGMGLAGPTASVKLNKTTRRLLGDFALWLSDRGVLIEAYDYEVPGAVARSIDE